MNYTRGIHLFRDYLCDTCATCADDQRPREFGLECRSQLLAIIPETRGKIFPICCPRRFEYRRYPFFLYRGDGLKLAACHLRLMVHLLALISVEIKKSVKK